MLRKLWAFYIGLSLVCQCFCASCCLTLITYHFQCLCNFSINYYKLFVSIKFVSLLLSHLPISYVYIVSLHLASVLKRVAILEKSCKLKKDPPPLQKKPRSIEKKKKWFNPTFMKNKAPTSNSLLTVAARLINIKAWSPASNKYMYWWVNLSSYVHMAVPVYKEQRDNSNNNIVVTDNL